MKTEAARQTVLFFRPGLVQGGADRVTITLLKHLDRTRFKPILCLFVREGELISEVPSDVPIYFLDAFNILTSLQPFRKLVAELNPDVVFSTCSGTNGVAVLACVGKEQRPRIVLSERNAIFHRRKTTSIRLQIALKHLTYALADEVNAVSEGVAADLRSHLGVSNVRVLYNPVVDETIERQMHEEVSDPWLRDRGDYWPVIHVGRLVEQKDHETLFRAFKILLGEHADARLILLGDGPRRTELRAIAESMGLTPFIRFVGFDSNPYKYIHRSAVFVLSSNQEGLPGTLIQAMATGTPVISTDCPAGPSEIISRPGVDGYLVPVGAHEAIAHHLIALKEDPQKASEMGRQGKETVARFGVDSVMLAYEESISGHQMMPRSHADPNRPMESA